MVKKSSKSKEALTAYYLKMKEVVEDTFNSEKSALEAKHALRVQKLKDVLQKQLAYYDAQIAQKKDS